MVMVWCGSLWCSKGEEAIWRKVDSAARGGCSQSLSTEKCGDQDVRAGFLSTEVGSRA